jgi:NAD+ kinase
MYWNIMPDKILIGLLPCADCGSCTDDNLGTLARQLTLETPASDQTACCGNHGICSHEVLRDEVPGHNPRSSHKMVGRKASFKLSWGCNGNKNGQHKHDFVSFEKGDITTAERSNKQVEILLLFVSFWNNMMYPLN